MMRTDSAATAAAGVEPDFLNPFYYSRPAALYGGSSEIQRNILAQYVLKLPG